MKKITLLLTVLVQFSSFAQSKNQQIVNSQLTNATIYFGYGAALDHTAKASLVNGPQEIIINNIATDLDVNTLQIGCPESVVLMSYRFNVKSESLPQTKTSATDQMADSIKMLQNQTLALNNEYATAEDVLNRTTKLIEGNLTANPKKDISSVELIKLVDYYVAKVEALKKSMYDIQLKRSAIDEKIANINVRINGYNESVYTPAKPHGQLILQIMAQSAAPATFNLSYFTRRAGWIPSYDMRIKTIDNSFKLAYKASVTQTTGIDWTNVKLTLSTSNPSQGGNIPVLNPWQISMYTPVLYETMKRQKTLDYKTQKTMALTDAPVAAGYDNKDKYEETSNVAAYTAVSESRLSTSFEINLPYDIPSDGKAYSVAIKEEQIKAGYKHYAAPRLDNDAFLMAEISDWQNLDLLPGEANIVMDNVYLGKSFINPNSTLDTLALSLGRDKRIALKRTTVKELTKSKIKGDNKSETFAWEITVKNNKKQPIEMSLKDQYPVSNIKEMEVTLDNDGQGEVNKEAGIIEWKVNLKAGESKTYRFGYTVKYPKDKVVQNLR